jgi:hypothetical protein
MGFYRGKLIELPKKGHAIIVTDIHGNLTDYNKYLELWKKYGEKNIHFIITGDFIHAMGRKDDRSIDILESVMHHFKNFKNFHALLGNHEWSAISMVSVYKGGVNQSHSFKSLLKDRFKKDWEFKLHEYQNFFKELPVAVKTDNKLFISHGGPPRHVNSIEDIVHITDNGYGEDNQKLYQLLWNREENFTRDDLNNFLGVVGSNAMVVGHTPVDGVKLVYDKQLVVSSSFSLGKKSYLVVNLKNNISKARDLLSMEKNLHWYS